MDLDRRKQSLLQAIVVTYVQRAEPVGSQLLASQEALGVRSATIRNELAEMTELGYLLQPHTSAGRVPSDQGYRYYVDHLMAWDRLSSADTRAIRGAQSISEGDVEQLLEQTCRVLSSLTRYTSVATPPGAGEPAVRQVHLAQTSPRRLLVVVVLDSGQVVHRFCEVPRDLSPAEVTQAGNLLAEKLRDVPIGQVSQIDPGAEALPGLEETLRVILGVIERGVTSEEGELVLDGASRMLDQPEFRDANRVEPLVRFLEERKTAYETLRRMLAQQNLTVIIGQENPHEAMHEVSVVAARYGAGTRMYGWIGVLGPTRMHYEHAVPAVEYAARRLSETLSRFGFG